jgi:Tfp pilus assembly ATPase PilU
MMVLEQHLASLVAAGTITYEDAVAASVHPEDIAGMANMVRQSTPAS